MKVSLLLIVLSMAFRPSLTLAGSPPPLDKEWEAAANKADGKLDPKVPTSTGTAGPCPGGCSRTASPESQAAAPARGLASPPVGAEPAADLSVD